MCGPSISVGRRSQDQASCPCRRNASLTIPLNSQAIRTRIQLLYLAEEVGSIVDAILMQYIRDVEFRRSDGRPKLASDLFIRPEVKDEREDDVLSLRQSYSRCHAYFAVTLLMTTVAGAPAS